MERINLTLDIRPNDIGTRRVNVRSSLLVANLIADVQDKFNLDGTLELRPAEGADPLRLDRPLEPQGVADGGTLICDRLMEDTGTMDAIARGVRDYFDEQFQRVYLTEQRTRTEYDLAWGPAILGRKDHRDPSKNKLLAVDLEGVEDLPTVSRHHACITMRGGSFFIETIQARNPTYLGGSQLKPGIRYPLSAGSVIEVGRTTLTFYVVS
jgi:hypothetical protein